MKRFLRAVGLGALLLTVLGLTVIGVLAWQINRLGSQDNAQPADAIVVLGAGVTRDGRPGSDLLSRTFHGMDLYQAGLAPAVICAGGVAGDPLAAGAVACRYAVQELGLPADRAFTSQDLSAATTAEEAKAVAALMQANGWRSLVLVSHPLHLFRARWLFQRQGLVVYTSPTNTNLRRIFPPLRAWYSLREAGGVVLAAVQDLPLVDKLVVWLSDLVYG